MKKWFKYFCDGGKGLWPDILLILNGLFSKGLFYFILHGYLKRGPRQALAEQMDETEVGEYVILQYLYIGYWHWEGVANKTDNWRS